jgi:hypothetical protein
MTGPDTTRASSQYKCTSPHRAFARMYGLLLFVLAVMLVVSAHASDSPFVFLAVVAVLWVLRPRDVLLERRGLALRSFGESRFVAYAEIRACTSETWSPLMPMGAVGRSPWFTERSVRFTLVDGTKLEVGVEAEVGRALIRDATERMRLDEEARNRPDPRGHAPRDPGDGGRERGDRNSEADGGLKPRFNGRCDRSRRHRGRAPNAEGASFPSVPRR